MTRLVTTAILLPIIAACGGGSESGRLAINGQVSFQKQPLADGRITLVPLSGNMRMATASIKEGRYEIRAKDGPGAGRYVVEIEAYRMEKDPHLPPHPYVEEASDGVVRRQFLPPQYNTNTKLTVDIADSQSEYDFSLD